MFSLVSHRALFLVRHLHSLLCTSLLFDWNSAFSSQSFAEDTELLQLCLPDQIHTTVLTMQTCISDIRSAWHKTNWMMTRSVLSSGNRIEPFFLMLSPVLLMLALPTFCSWPVLRTLVSWLQTSQAPFSFCLHRNQMQQLYLPVPNCWSNQNSSLCFCSLQIGLL